MMQPLPERPLLKRHLFAATIEPGEIFLLTEDRSWLWKSRSLGLLLPSLDGTRTLSELFEQLGSAVTPPEIIYLLNQLHGAALLAEGPTATAPPPPDRALAFWHALGVDQERVPQGGQHPPIHLRAAAPAIDTEPLAQALRAAGFALADGGGAEFEVVVADHYFRQELSEINRAALARQSPWLLCKLVGQTLWLGPIFRPGRTGCLTCLQERLRLNRQVEDYVVRKTGNPSYYETSLGVLPTASRLGAACLVQEIMLWHAGRTDRLEGKLLAVGITSEGLDVSTHELARRPQCPSCGTVDRNRLVAPITLQSRPVAHASDGGHRVETAEATLLRLNPHISPITGVVTWLSSTFQDPEGLVHCYSAGHNFALGPDTAHWLRQSLRSRTGGKGTTSTQARASAVCEAIERYCGVFRDDVPRIRATYRALGATAVHPRACLNFSEQQYQHRDERNADDRQGFFHLIPRRFPEDLEIDWAAAWSLTHNTVRHLPAAFCYYGHPDVERHFYCTGDANGCAAGTVIEEAVLQAFLELVERDSAAIWWYNRIPRPAVNLDSVRSAYLGRLRDWYERNGRELWVLDITSDLGIPVFAAISRRVDGPAQDLLIGLGAHLDPTIALLRAVTEVNQFLPAVSRRDATGATVYAWPDDAAVRFWKAETLRQQPHLVPDPTATPREIVAAAKPAKADLLDSLQACRDIAARAGLEIIVLDQSRPDIDLKVVRVVVPGLRHFWRRLGPGRLYDVPVKLGWRATPTAEDDLNPTSIFF